MARQQPHVANALDSAYFTKVSHNDEYTVYRMKMPALVLLSANDVPLLVVSIERMVVVPYIGGYQAISAQDAIPVRFVLTNCTDIDYIAIDILHRDPVHYAATETDPGPEWGINQVNEIKPGQTCIIEVDQRTGETMELRALSSHITVAQDTKNVQSGLGSVSQSLHVMARPPSDCPRLQAMFVGAYWKTIDTIVRREKPVLTSKNAFCDGGRWYNDDFVERSYYQPRSYQLGESSAMVTRRKKGRGAEPEPNIVADSHVAAIYRTGHRVDVASGVSNVLYDGSCKCVTRLNLSVNTSMQMHHVDPKSVPDYVTEWVQALMASRRCELIEGIDRIFKADECVLCLQPDPDLLILGCAHQCLHAACVQGHRMDKCFMCRGNITATLKI